MGRSVMTHPNAKATVTFWFEPEHYDPDTEEFTRSSDIPCGAYCDHSYEWEALVESITDDVLDMFPSMVGVTELDIWEHREINIIAENKIAKVGISNYCDLIAVSLIPVTDPDNWKHDHEQLYILGSHWITQVTSKFHNMIKGYVTNG